jgi:hypothetical protein
MMLSRRSLLTASLFGAGSLTLRSLATGIPISMLVDPLAAAAQEPTKHRILILSVSRDGEPLNANAPGMYENHLKDVVHPSDPSMAPTQLKLGDQLTTAAKPWAELPASARNRMCVFHHATYTGLHAQNQDVMSLMGNTQRNEMAVSIYAKELGKALGTTQTEPITLGANGVELVRFDGRTLSNVAPSSLYRILGRPDGPLGGLQELRDKDLDRIHAVLGKHGTKAQRSTLDRYATTRRQARSVSDALIGQLSKIENNEMEDQAIAAPVIAAMGLSPVITVHLKFGMDNHRDPGFGQETSQHISGMSALGSMIEVLESFKSQGVLKHEVMVGVTGVFGRTLSKPTGRDHNSRHNVTLLIGDGIRPGVIGGCENVGKGHSAMGIDKNTGQGVPGGAGIPVEASLQTMAKTMGAALGVSAAHLEANIEGGEIIERALV